MQKTIIFLIVACGNIALYADDTFIANPKKQYSSISLAGVYENYFFHSAGLSAEVSNGWLIWSAQHTTGYLEAGILTTYTVESYTQSGNVFDFEESTGASHHVKGIIKLGVATYVPHGKHIVLGIYLFGGWSHKIMRGHLTNIKYGVDRDYTADKGSVTSGLICCAGYKISEKFTIVSSGSYTLPNRMIEINSVYAVSLGCSYLIR